MPKAFKAISGLLIALVIVSFALLVHHVNTLGQPSLLGALLALAPLLLIAFVFAINIDSKLLGIGFILLVLISSWWALPLIKQHTGLIFWLQDIGLMLMLLITFARTLQAGRKPLCVGFAEAINGGPLPADHERYAYHVTIAWVTFFGLMIIVSSLLFFFSPLATWSFFVNFLTLPLVALMFIAEFLVRRTVLTDLPNGNVMDAVRAYLDSRQS
ncbi:hypothetical protein [Methylophilus sp. Leaf414]|uniref:COG4648 family protein n=1 Tax=Methylophilus sp. Leaf414 TaxID=1736371 RepID=UPI0006F52A41|nr:hypothetical protein [Methylophilus sp. Leaf414]KQT37460.1 hypothetical protein ASG24_00160 [Methylophilus sp. Leaf414]